MSLRTSRLHHHKLEFDQSPMDGLANMADLMLVLACGLMLSLVISWNVDLARDIDMISMEQGAEVTELEGLEENTGGLAEGTNYEELGVVYKDPVTGKLYMVTDK